MYRASVLVTVFLLAGHVAAAEVEVLTDPHGNVASLRVRGEDLPLRLDLRLPAKGWTGNGRLNPARLAESSVAEGVKSWQGMVTLDRTHVGRYSIRLRQEAEAFVVELTVTAEDDLDVEGVYLWGQLPVSLFRGGTATIISEDGRETSADCPLTLPEKYIFLGGRAQGASIVDAGKHTAVDFHFADAINIQLQDERKFSGSDYSFMFQLARGPLQSGQQASARVRIVPTATPDTSPANLSLDVRQVRYKLDGFGGNYCFAIDTPPAQYTLDHLRSAWARVEMVAADWAPDPADFAAGEPDWQKLEARDTPGSKLRRRFEFDRQLSQRSLPLVSSVWWLPEWLYGDSSRKRADGHRRIVPRDKWPQLADVVSSYLLHGKRRYGVEPDLFSFNESNIGVMVLMTPEEHRDVIKLLGAHFAKRGLKTKLLLGDSTGAGSIEFTSAAAADAEALQYVGAIAFHSWGGAESSVYTGWAELAERLQLPLLVTELGVDANYSVRPHEQPGYGLREVRMYQELLLHARPTATMYWEFTSDYSLVKWTRGAEGRSPEISPTDRFYFTKQFCNLTPPQADALGTTSDHSQVLVTAFAAGADSQRVYTIHIANFGAARDARITGLPAGVKQFRVLCTGDTDMYRELPPIQISGTETHLALPARGLLTLTTVSQQ